MTFSEFVAQLRTKDVSIVGVDGRCWIVRTALGSIAYVPFPPGWIAPGFIGNTRQNVPVPLRVEQAIATYKRLHVEIV